jgi:D-tyrosyl-tRNA(Tyr) deacylase
MANELNAETLNVALKSIDEFATRELPDSLLIELDERDTFPEELVRRMSSAEELGIQLLFVPYEYGGMGGGAFDVYRICERMAAIDVGLATSELATFLGSDPIRVGGTEEQKREYMSRIAKEGVLFAYGATEPEAGSDLGALKTIAEPVAENGKVTGYMISGAKQWISNGGVADLYTILALAPGGPSWFIIESGADGFTHGKHEDKHGIRLSNTAALFLDKVHVEADRLVGGVEGQGLVQAQQVFGYTRLMVAAFGLGAGWAALDRAIPYSQKRIQAGGPLSEKEGYTDKLIVPHAVALEASRAAIEETAERLDAGEGQLNVEGAIAKYLATEAGDAAADAAIQAHGGYGYTHDYMVEKICGLRVFEDPNGKMNLGVSEVGGAVLAVSQFTLYGDVRRGRRPSFDEAARPEHAREMYQQFVARVRAAGLRCETGRFQEMMEVELVNDGPVTFLLDSTKIF